MPAQGSGAAAARGVAPGVTFGAYRVFGCDGAASSDVILAALERAYRALSEYMIGGVKTTIPLHKAIMADPTFIDGKATTAYMEDFPLVARSKTKDSC